MLGWDELTKPKRMGGAGIKLAQRMDGALLAKLAWRVLTSEGELWCETLRAKYGVELNDGARFRPKQRSSQVWKAVVWGAELLHKV